MSDFDMYQNDIKRFAIYPVVGHPVVYPTLGLANEAGEFAGKIKKIFRDANGEISDETRTALADELGDVLWYLTQCATELGLDLSDIALQNFTKLWDRQERGVIQGSGDKR